MSLSRKAKYYAKVLGHPPQLLQPLSGYFKIYSASAPLRTSFGGVIVGLQVVDVEMKSWGDSGEADRTQAGDLVAANLGSLLPAAQLGAR